MSLSESHSYITPGGKVGIFMLKSGLVFFAKVEQRLARTQDNYLDVYVSKPRVIRVQPISETQQQIAVIPVVPQGAFFNENQRTLKISEDDILWEFECISELEKVYLEQTSGILLQTGHH
jgi:hypothetical protein